ncbi:hypothetical protein B0H14DRAFT_3128666 [Mycena olivaceomarginata]|nr:hypothetical protein B0H14DRAFT_3128666 [Mycena olivaceomarginata]
MTVRRSKRLNPRHLTPRRERYARRASKALDEEENRYSCKTLKHQAHTLQSARVLWTNSLVPIRAPLPKLHHIVHRNDEVPNKRSTAGLPTASRSNLCPANPGDILNTSSPALAELPDKCPAVATDDGGASEGSSCIQPLDLSDQELWDMFMHPIGNDAP